MSSIGTTPPERDSTRLSRAVQRAVLEISFPGQPPTRFSLNESPVIIGRTEEADLQLEHQSVSRRHAEMVCDAAGRWRIRDLGSTNGTQIGGTHVIEHFLSPGDRIGIGDYLIGFDLVPERERLGPDSIDFSAYSDDKPTVIRGLLELEPPRIAAGHLRTLFEFSRRLLEIKGADERRAALCDLIVGSEFSGTMACILQVERARWKLLSGLHRPGRPLREGRPYISARVLERIRETGQAVLATNVAGQSQGETPAIEISMAREVMELWVIACPISFDGDKMKVLYAYIPRDCGSAEWLNLYALAAEVYRQGEMACAARERDEQHAVFQREVETAKQIQLGLLPRKLGVPGLDIAIGFKPCNKVGGDYVDVVHLPDGRLLLGVADVCGKGLQAALVGSSLHTIVRAACDAAPTLGDLFGRANRHLCEWLPSHSFVTMTAAVVDPVTGYVECVNAGHPPPFIVDRRGARRIMQEAENPALGIAEVAFAAQSIRLDPGDVLVMYTDGLTELRNESREMLGEKRLGELLSEICVRLRSWGIDALSKELDTQLEMYRGEEQSEDDRTFLLARRG